MTKLFVFLKISCRAGSPSEQLLNGFAVDSREFDSTPAMED